MRDIKLSLVQEQNKKNDWWGWNITLEKSVNDLKNPKYIFEEAKIFHDLVTSGQIDPAPEAREDVDNSQETSMNNPTQQVLG